MDDSRSGLDVAALQQMRLPAIRAFEQSLAASRFADKTIATYIERVGEFLRWLAASAHSHALTNANSLDSAVADYVGDLRERRAAPSTINVSLAALDQFAEWLSLGDVLAPREVVDQIIPKTLNAAEQRKLLFSAEGRWIRDYAIVVLLLHAGPRESEIQALDREHLDLESASGGSTVLGATGPWRRRFPLGPGACTALRLWRAERTRILGTDADGPLFVSRTNARSRLSIRQIDRIVRTIGAAADLTISPSTLRNTCEQQLLLEGHHPNAVAALMGQQSSNRARVDALAPIPQLEFDFTA
ncbi:tyrosine-type recombinase/integrase [Nocardia sp. NPDC058518]|uniref:tyrosine-type recombinase/integrase n=1 Tax=Nocardia sp. NPDC058518 TaxID=3346534 RepID=UPI00364DBD8A